MQVGHVPLERTLQPRHRNMYLNPIASSEAVRRAENSAAYVLDAIEPWRLEPHDTGVLPTNPM